MTLLAFLSRGIDYLGDLGGKLRDLQGYRTLAYELIQNADDASGATSMVFDVREGELIVDNDGVFSDCGQVEHSECPWKSDMARNHRCDFHRLRHVASGDKRGEANTTGAFGIGFIAVYQMTDRPELISAGRHWILNEDRPEHERIQVCRGCPNCSASDVPGTRFTLPWARDPDSTLRKALRADAVSSQGPQVLADELERTLPVAMLFLRRLRMIDIRRDGRSVRKFERLVEGDSLIVSDGDPKNDRVWHVVRGDFSEAAVRLRQRHVDRIEVKRSAVVTIAVPETTEDPGLLCACLPTEQTEGLPFHVNADFFTTNDRKGVILAADYQSEWNREALRAAARAIGSALERLPRLITAQRFWHLASSLEEVARRSEQGRGEPTLAEFWKEVARRLPEAHVIQTTMGGWAAAASTSLLHQKEEADAIAVLEALGVKVVHEDLRPYQSLLRSNAVGVPLLNVERVCQALAGLGLNQRTEQSAFPSGLEAETGRQSLWKEVAVLLERQRTPKAKAEDERRLREVALAPGRDGALWPSKDIFAADDETVALFEPLGLGIPFVTSDSAFAQLSHLCRRLNAAAAIEVLSGCDGKELERLWQEGQLSLPALFEWFENRRQEISADPELKANLGALPLFPGSSSLHQLRKLALPGNFSDPLGLAELVDVDALGGRQGFLQYLGMRELDFETYATFRLPEALAGDDVPQAKRRASALLLASRLGELKDREAARTALADAPLVECADGIFRKAHECHFDSDGVRDCLGAVAHLAVLPSGHEVAVRDLYKWLGVVDEPRLGDIVSVVRELTGQPYSAAIALRIQNTVAHLGQRLEADENPNELQPLQGATWLPARGRTDRWYSPNELYAVYQVYLFESQALFLDAPANIQTASRTLLQFLGVHLTPSVALVVRHLEHCAMQQIAVNAEVYRFLNDKVDDPALRPLLGTKCLSLGDAYRAPSEVFWSDHPFGRYRWRLSDELRGYSKLLKRLGVRDSHTHEDALNVLMDISSQFGEGNLPLDEDAHVVLMACWRILDAALDSALSVEDLTKLSSVKCVPRADGVLHPPEWMFFENRAGLAAKFGAFLANNVVPRPLGAGNAFAAAGVRQLGSAVEIELLECTDPADDPGMAQRIRLRRNEVARVLGSQALGHAADALCRLDRIRCETAASLAIRYRLRAFNREMDSKPEHAPAFYQSEHETLFFLRQEGHTRWPALARELAIALFPDEDPGRFAAGLKEVLAAESPAEASAVLDELGLAPLDTAVLDASPGAEAPSTLGTETPPAGGSAVSPPLGAPKPPDREVLTPEDALNRLLGPDAPPPTPPAQDSVAEPVSTGGARGGRRRSGSAAKPGRPVLRSYLPAPDGTAPGSAYPNDEGAGQERSPVDQAGVRHVLDYEKRAGRMPKEMPHRNPGYDVESRDLSGNVVRFIEIKSFSGRWSNTYADLSRPQFEKATNLRDTFWLYVVERAESENFHIYRIQNPALKANHFLFDDGWRALAESAQASKGE